MPREGRYRVKETYCKPGNRFASRIHQCTWIDLVPQFRINWRLSVLACNDDQRVVIITLRLQFRNDLAQRRIHKVKSLEDAGTEGRVIVVLQGLLCDGDTLKIPAHYCRHASDLGTPRSDGSVDWSSAIDPFKPGVHMKLVVRDCSIERIRCGSHFWEVAFRKPFTTGPTNEVVRRVLVSIYCLKACCSRYFKDGINAYAHVGVDWFTDAAVHESHWEFGGI